MFYHKSIFFILYVFAFTSLCIVGCKKKSKGFILQESVEIQPDSVTWEDCLSYISTDDIGIISAKDSLLYLGDSSFSVINRRSKVLCYRWRDNMVIVQNENMKGIFLFKDGHIIDIIGCSLTYKTIVVDGGYFYQIFEYNWDKKEELDILTCFPQTQIIHITRNITLLPTLTESQP